MHTHVHFNKYEFSFYANLNLFTICIIADSYFLTLVLIFSNYNIRWCLNGFER